MGTEPFIATISPVGFNFAPRGWAFCHGQILSIAQNTALFSLLGVTYGGNGQTTFALPNLQSRTPVGQSSQRPMGELAGVETVALQASHLPFHTHQVRATTTAGYGRKPVAGVPARSMTGSNLYAEPGTLQPLAAQSSSPSGGGQAHNNMQPYLAVNFVIALQGIYPARN